MEYKPISDRLILARFHSKFRNITVIQCYAPTEPDNDDTKSAFYDQLEATIAQARKSDIKIVLGDFNAKVGTDNTNIQSVMGRHGLGNECNNNGSRLLDLCAAHQLFIGGTKFPHLDIHKYTWQSPDQVTRNQIDHFLISKKFLGSLLDVKTIRGADVYSDHQLLVGIVKLRPAALYQQRRSNRRFNTQRLQDPAIVESFCTEINNKCAASDVHTWTSIESAFKQSAEEVLGFTQHPRKPWIREPTWKKIEERQKLKTQMNAARLQVDKQRVLEEYNEAERQVKKLVRADRRQYYEEIAADAEKAANCGNMRGVYSAIRQLSGGRTKTAPPLRDANDQVLTTEQQQLDRWKEFFEGSPSNPDVLVPLNRQDRRNPRREVITSPPTVQEIDRAIGKLKNNKSPGPDNIPAELFKYSANILAPILMPMIKEAWLSCSIPDSWKEGVIVTIPKKGDLSQCKNWRGITLLNTIQKLLAFIILDRISPTVETLLRREQAGFRQNRSCVDHINTLRLIVEQSVEWNSSVYLLFVDFERAFDMLHRDAIWNTLQSLGIPETIVQLIRELYREAPCKVRSKGTDSASFTISRGVRQGCVLSPILFLLVLDSVMMQTNQEAPNGIQWRINQKLNDLDYADDICLMSHTCSGIQQKLDRLAANAEKVGLNINIRKTKLLRIGTRSTTPITLNGVQIEDVQEFCYLGSMISKDGGSESDVKSRINKARHAYHSLGRVWNSSQISKRHKLHIFNASVKSVLLYGSETWRVTDNISNKLQVFVNKCLRRIMKIFWPDRISNPNLLQQTNQLAIQKQIQKRKWRWIGHTLRKPESDIARMSFEWNPPGNRSRGRPRLTWRRSVEKEYESTGRTWLQIKQLARCRKRWKEFANSMSI